MIELVGAAEVAELLQLSRQRVHKIIQTHADFPEPLGRLRSGPVWRRSDIEKWARKNGRQLESK